MKKNCLSMAAVVMLLGGCTVYGNGTAPVTTLNQRQPPPPQTNTAQVPVYPGQATAVTPHYTRPMQPQFAQPQAIRPQSYPQAAFNNGVQVIAQSPYGAAGAQPYQPQSNNDSWAVAPQPPVQDVQQTPQQQPIRDEPKPMRPEERQPDSNINTAATETTSPTSGSVPQSTGSSSEQVAIAAPTQPSRPAADETAVSVLLKKANASLGKGDLDGAAAYLENAQRIEPQNAKILYDIANIRYHQGRYKDAENFAGRATSKGGSNAMMKKTWALIANARKQLGDNQGAIAAAEKAASYGN